MIQRARELAAGPTEAFGVTTRLMNRAVGIDRLDYHLGQELEALARSADSAAFAEGIDAFFGKRAPDFPSTRETVAATEETADA